MANQITGKILYIYPPQQLPAKDGSKTFVKRSIVLDCTRFDPYTGERGFENTPLLEFFGDRCQELDKYRVGQVVTVSFDVTGSRYTNRDGREQIFTRVNPYRIELRASRQSPESAPMQPAPAPSMPAQSAPVQPMQQPSVQPWEPPQVDDQGYVVEDKLPF